jgi:ABC-type amino acid transport substrate-binding protein
MRKSVLVAILIPAILLAMSLFVHADLAQIKESGVLRHLGIPYSNFVTGDGDGLDVEIIKLYANEIGVKYEHVPTSWETVVSDLSGKKIIPKGDEVEIIGKAPVKGDIIGNGLTVLPWRRKVINFSTSYFPSAIWVVARFDSDLKPIKPSGNRNSDISLTKNMLKRRQILGIRNTCLDPDLYNIAGSVSMYKDGLQLNDLPAAIIRGDSDVTLLDAPEALLALANYPGKLKIVGALSEEQEMAFGISMDSPELLKSFNAFLSGLKSSGKLRELIIKYYPLITNYFPRVAD